MHIIPQQAAVMDYETNLGRLLSADFDTFKKEPLNTNLCPSKWEWYCCLSVNLIECFNVAS